MALFPAIGQTYEANFNDGTILVHLAFDKDGEHMTFTDAGSKMPGMKASETIRYTAAEIRPPVFVVHWQEKDKMTVVHVEDFERGTVRSHITSPKGEFWQLAGSLKKVTG